MLLVAAIACAGPRPSAPTPPARFTVARPDPVAPELRLPDDVVPLAYRAQLSLDAKALAGTMEIDIRVDKTTDVIWMHGEGLTIARADAVAADGTAIQLDVRALKRFDSTSRFLALLAPLPLAAGPYTLRFSYSAPVVDRGSVDAAMLEWYREQPRNEGVFREMVEGQAYTFTQFEPMAARKVFPCFDEPNRKTPWQLTLDVPVGNIALSNTTVVAVSALPDGRRRFEFAPTLPLPSYVIAFAVGPFDLVDAGASVHGVPIRIAVRKGHAAHASWAAKSTAHILDLVDLAVGIPMPYPKIDVVAVPITGMGWGAMENPGLVTMSENLLRADGTLGSSRELYVSIAAHEIAHQWFGNYVTPAWWDDIWLNESFATWLGKKITNDLRTTWAAELVMPAPLPAPPPPPPPGWGRDAFRGRGTNARPPLAQTHDYAQLAPYFSGEGGVPTIEMLASLVGETELRAALQSYLTAHAHGVVTTDDLARSIGAHAKLPLDGLIAAFLAGNARSSVHVSIDCKRGNAPPAIVVEHTGTADDIVPVCFAYGTATSRTDACIILDAPRKEVPVASCPRWLVPNPRELPYSGPIDDWEAVLTFGWGHLTTSERRMLPAAQGDRHRLAVALRLLDDSSASAMSAGSTQLDPIVRYLPEDLRSRFDARLRGMLAKRVPRAHLRDQTTKRPAVYTEAMALLELWILARDPETLREARELFPRRDELLPPLARAVTAATFRSDPAAAARMLDARIAPDRPRYDQTVTLLADSPYILALIESRGAAAATLADYDLTTLLTNHCEPARRAQVARLANALRPGDTALIITAFDACVKQRAIMEPVFRAWIDSKP